LDYTIPPARKWATLKIRPFLARAAEKKQSWSEHLNVVCYAYNPTPNSTTGYSPFSVMFGCDPWLPIDRWDQKRAQTISQTVGSPDIKKAKRLLVRRGDRGFKYEAVSTPFMKTTTMVC